MFLVFVNKKNVPFSNWIVSNPVMAEKNKGGRRESRDKMERK